MTIYFKRIQLLGVSFARCLTSRKTLPTLTLYTKDECQLCEEALGVLQPYKHRLEEVDIMKKENKNWFNKYRYDIPVFHFNGTFLMKHRVDQQALEKALRQYEEKTSSS